jgi:hypothetical protein
MEKQKPQLNIDFTNTTSVEAPAGNKIFHQGFLLRKVSKFLIGSDEDALLPIPVMFDPKTEKIVGDTLPPELRDFYKDDILFLA